MTIKATYTVSRSGQLVEVSEAHPRELVWVKTGQTLEQAIVEAEKPPHKRHNRKKK